MGGSRQDREQKQNLVMVFKDTENTFFEVESVINKRVRDGLVEYLIKWKGCPLSQSSWEPCANLCDSAMEEARKFEAEKKKKTSKKTPQPVVSLPGNTRKLDPPPPPLEDGRWRWTDEEQLKYQEVERIDVNNSDSRQRITEARLNGTPVVLVGHVGWANFADKWLIPINSAEKIDQTRGSNRESKWLDLSLNHKLDIKRMTADIGDEVVPMLQRDYDERNPLQAAMKASVFLKTFWPDDNGKCFSTDSLYLHQWQFPLSKSAGKKLCHKNNPLPNNILGTDLLKYWLDLSQCKYDSPLQYIFMGRADTMSKLHCDNGGLEISIAPIIGQKECILVHRLDGDSCLYDLDASLDNVDLQMYPLMEKARIWKTCVKPGEILLMPQGTYHQCRNVTPCLSYSRFHLDTINLLPFLQSMIDEDADEIDHGEVIWNSSTELIDALDKFVDNCKSFRKSTPPKPMPTLSNEVIENINTLRSLRNICQEIARRLGTHKKGRKRRRQRDAAGDSYVNSEVGMGSKCYALENWVRIMEEIDDSLHHFRHRNLTKPPVRIRKITDPERTVHANGKGHTRIRRPAPRQDSIKRQRNTRRPVSVPIGQKVEQYEDLKGGDSPFDHSMRPVRPIRVSTKFEPNTYTGIENGQKTGTNKKSIVYSLSEIRALFTKRRKISGCEDYGYKVEEIEYLLPNNFIFENQICDDIDVSMKRKDEQFHRQDSLVGDHRLGKNESSRSFPMSKVETVNDNHPRLKGRDVNPYRHNSTDSSSHLAKNGSSKRVLTSGTVTNDSHLVVKNKDWELDRQAPLTECLQSLRRSPEKVQFKNAIADNTHLSTKDKDLKGRDVNPYRHKSADSSSHLVKNGWSKRVLTSGTVTNDSHLVVKNKDWELGRQTPLNDCLESVRRSPEKVQFKNVIADNTHLSTKDKDTGIHQQFVFTKGFVELARNGSSKTVPIFESKMSDDNQIFVRDKGTDLYLFEKNESSKCVPRPCSNF